MLETSGWRWRVAVHETGHAIVGHMLGKYLERIEIFDDEAGKTKFLPGLCEVVAHEMAVIWAGLVGEREFLDDFVGNFGGDWELSSRLAAAKELSADEHKRLRTEGEEIATALIRKNRTTFDRVVQALSIRGSLSRDEFLQLIAGTDP